VLSRTESGNFRDFIASTRVVLSRTGVNVKAEAELAHAFGYYHNLYYSFNDIVSDDASQLCLTRR